MYFSTRNLHQLLRAIPVLCRNNIAFYFSQLTFSSHRQRTRTHTLYYAPRLFYFCCANSRELLSNFVYRYNRGRSGRKGEKSEGARDIKRAVSLSKTYFKREAVLVARGIIERYRNFFFAIELRREFDLFRGARGVKTDDSFVASLFFSLSFSAIHPAAIHPVNNPPRASLDFFLFSFYPDANFSRRE